MSTQTLVILAAALRKWLEQTQREQVLEANGLNFSEVDLSITKL